VLYNGVFGSLRGWGHSVTGFGVAALIVLSTAGGIALLTFSKAFGVGFLGKSRSSLMGSERNSPAFYAVLLLLGITLLLGIYPVFFVKTTYQVAAASFPIPDAVFIRQSMLYTIGRASVAVGFMVALAGGIFLLRRHLFSKRHIRYADTWACGATVATSRTQYTAGSYSGEFAALTSPLNSSKRYMESLNESQIFAPQRTFHSVNHDVFRTKIRPYVKQLGTQMNKLAIFQTGRVHHYILYALLFMMLVLGLTYFEII
jgi:hypothetical protein